MRKGKGKFIIGISSTFTACTIISTSMKKKIMFPTTASVKGTSGQTSFVRVLFPSENFSSPSYGVERLCYIGYVDGHVSDPA